MGEQCQERNCVGTVRKLWEFMSFDKLKVHSKVVGMNRRLRNGKISSFMTRSRSVRHHKSTLQLPLDIL